MRISSSLATVSRCVVLAACLVGGSAMAQQEPTMNQIYATAQAGKLEQAQVMVQQVLVTHPNSAKAHFVQSELYARQGDLGRAREALSEAERLAPGLPFAKPDAVQALKAQLAAPVAKQAQAVAIPSPAAPASGPSGGWMLPALLAVGVIGAAYFIFRRKTPQVYDQAPAYAGGLNGPQTFGSPAMQPGYGPGAYGQAPGTGLGGRIMGGVATGLAVGAGVMAAEAIGRNFMGGHDTTSRTADFAGTYEPVAVNADMGGQDFGINDTSWDDGGSAGSDGGGDWDN